MPQFRFTFDCRWGPLVVNGDAATNSKREAGSITMSNWV